MIVFLPIAFTVAKIIGKPISRYYEDKGIKSGVRQATKEGSVEIKAFLKGNFIIMSANVFIIIFSVLIFSKFNLNLAKFLISSIYTSSVLYSIYGIIKRFNEIIFFIFDCKLNPKVFLEYELHKKIRKEVDKEYTSTKDFISILLGGRGKYGVTSEITKKAKDNLIKYHTIQFLWFVAVFFIYVFIFRFFTIGILLENSVHLNTIQAFFYPFFISFKQCFSFLF